MKIPQLLNLQHIHHNDGDITVVENNDQLPFVVKRVYWLTGIKKQQIRGNNATVVGKRLLIALNGQIEVKLKDASAKSCEYLLNSPQIGLFIPNGYWSEITFYESAIVLCLVSNEFDENDYIRDFEQFLAYDWSQ